MYCNWNIFARFCFYLEFFMYAFFFNFAIYEFLVTLPLTQLKRWVYFKCLHLHARCILILARMLLLMFVTENYWAAVNRLSGLLNRTTSNWLVWMKRYLKINPVVITWSWTCRDQFGNERLTLKRLCLFFETFSNISVTNNSRVNSKEKPFSF